jgi:hypothetical protein
LVNLTKSLLAVKKLRIVIHYFAGHSELSIDSQLSESLLNGYLFVVVQNTAVHLLFSTSNLDVTGHSCESYFEKPFVTDIALDRRFNRLQAKALLAKCKPMAIASLTSEVLSPCSQFLSFESKVLLHQALVNKGIKDEAELLCLKFLLHCLNFDLIHLVYGQSLHGFEKHRTAVVQSSFFTLDCHSLKRAEGDLQENCLVVRNRDFRKGEGHEKSIAPLL